MPAATDDALTSLDSNGKIPDPLGPYPDRALAHELCAKNGGKVAAYALNNATPKKAVVIGFWVGNAPVLNPYDGQPKASTIPPQWRAADSKSAFDIFNVRSNRTFEIDPKTGEKIWTDIPGRNGMENQPDWSWAPEQLPAKPNKLNGK
ncbi:hypothetical protein MF451_003803 [Salmonella enterica subsp. enterica serovar Saintpaul]|nr:hypothetical protein [Salmonella enterica subsp. enterica serovar Saintpaul]